jgi:hypothetical protein
MRTARTAVVVTAALVSLSLGGGTAHAAQTVAPTALPNDGTKTFTITGAPAKATEAVVLKLAGHPDISGTVSNPDAGALCSLGVADSDCGSSITVSVNLLSAFPGRYDVVRTQTPAGLGGSASTTTLPAALAVLSQPLFAASNPVAPAVRGQGASSRITVTGTGFAPGIVASFGPGTTVSDLAVGADGTSLTANVAVGPDAVIGARDVSLTSADGLSKTLPAGFAVSAQPVLTGIDPAKSTGKAAETVTGVRFTGDKLVGGGDFGLLIAGVDVKNVVVAPDGKSVTADLAVKSTSAAGPRTVRVTNNDGGRAVLNDAFTVVAPPAAPASVVAFPDDTVAYVTWTAPSTPGSGPVTGYRVTALPEISVDVTDPTKRAVAVPGLVNGKAYTFTVTAKNAEVGFGAGRAAGPVTPKYRTVLTSKASRATAVSGQSVTWSGVLTRGNGNLPIAGAPVNVVVRPQVGKASTKAVTTDAQGRWSISATTVYTTAVTASYAGSALEASVASVPVTTPTATKVTVSGPKSGGTTSISKPLVITGSVSPNKAGKSVGVYKVVGGTRQLVGTAKVAANGTYRASVKLARGDYLLMVAIGPTPGNTSASSPRFVVKRR